MPSNNNNNAKPPVYNPHWKGYCYLFLSSLINLSATTNTPNTNLTYTGNWSVAVSFGAFTLVFVSLVLIQDRTQFLVETFHYTTAWQGKLEGYVLSTLCLYWIIGVSYLTQVQGIAYTVLNVYLSAWLSLASALYTLNQWSTKHDILSWAELTSVTVTLKSWYILWIGSLVVLGTSCNYYIFLQNYYKDNKSTTDDHTNAAIIGMILGAGSTILSTTFIFIPYRLIAPCQTGGVAEIVAALSMTLCWIVGCAVLTREGAIGATIVGRGCEAVWENLEEENTMEWEALASSSCIVQILLADGENTSLPVLSLANVTVPCETLGDVATPSVPFVPGSNLYVSVWTCMGASINLLLRWKAQQSLKFAQAQEEHNNRRNSKREEGAEDEDDAPSVSDNGYDTDEFVDAVDDT